jgi:hypothetical protein
LLDAFRDQKRHVVAKLLHTERVFRLDKTSMDACKALEPKDE